MLLQEALRKEETAGVEGPAVPCVQMHHFEAALSRVQPSVSPRDQLMYESLRQKLRRCALYEDRHMWLAAAYHLCGETDLLCYMADHGHNISPRTQLWYE